MVHPPGFCKAKVLTNKMSSLQVPASSITITKKTPGPVLPNLDEPTFKELAPQKSHIHFDPFAHCY